MNIKKVRIFFFLYKFNCAIRKLINSRPAPLPFQPQNPPEKSGQALKGIAVSDIPEVEKWSIKR